MRNILLLDEWSVPLMTLVAYIMIAMVLGFAHGCYNQIVLRPCCSLDASYNLIFALSVILEIVSMIIKLLHCCLALPNGMQDIHVY